MSDHTTTTSTTTPTTTPTARTDFDLTITRAQLAAVAPDLVTTLREFVSYGSCRQGNTAERKALAEKFAKLSSATLRQFPDLKLNHCGARTCVVDEPKEQER